MNPILLLLVVAMLLAGCGQPTVAKNGGCVLIFRPMVGEKAAPEVLARAIQARLRAGGLKHAVATAEAGTIRVALPLVTNGSADLAKAKALIAHQGVLEFCIVAERGVHDEVIADAEVAPIGAGPKFKWVRMDPERVGDAAAMVTRTGAGGAQETLVIVDPDVEITGDHLQSISPALDSQAAPCLSGTLNAEGAAKMAHLTTNNLQRRLGMIFDDELLSAPVIQSKIDGTFQLTGRFTQEEVDSLVAVLRTGTLPGRLEERPVSEEYIQPK